MNLYLRLFWTMFVSRFKSKISVLEELTSNHIVWPNDLDLLGHINNGRYFTITDYVRIGCLIRAGIWQEMRKRDILPLMAGETAQFRIPIKPFQKYQIKTRAIGWDKKFLYVEHIFSSKKGIHAILLVKVVPVAFGETKATPAEILRYVHKEEDIPEINVDEVITNWNSSSDGHWSEHKTVLNQATE